MREESLSVFVTLPVSLKPRMVIRRVSAATSVRADDLVQRDPGRESQVQCPNLSPRWEERVRAQLARWENMFSKNYFDVGFAKYAQHRIRLSEDRSF